MEQMLTPASVFGQFPQEGALFRDYRKSLDFFPKPVALRSGTTPPPAQDCRLRLLFGRGEEHVRTPLRPGAVAKLPYFGNGPDPSLHVSLLRSQEGLTPFFTGSSSHALEVANRPTPLHWAALHVLKISAILGMLNSWRTL